MVTMNAAPHSAFRLATLVLAAILGAQSIWLLLAELSRPGFNRLAPDAQAASSAARPRNDAIWAARIGVIRGDLWAESAFTYSGLLWSSPDTDPEGTNALAHARSSLDKALGYAPHRADAWLLLAGLESRYEPHKSDPTAALRMSYYIGPSERPLMPLRLLVTTHLDALDDIELQQFVRRDLRSLLAQQQNSAVAEAYGGASSAGKRFIEQALGEIDPAYLALLSTGTP